MTIEVPGAQWAKFRYFSANPGRSIESLSRTEIVTINEVPTRCFYGTQALGEYTNRKARNIKRQYAATGGIFLTEFPVISCAIPIQQEFDSNGYAQLLSDKEYYLALLDGHHRVRYAPEFDIHSVPSYVLTVNQGARAYGLEPYQFVNQIQTWTADALASFSKKFPGLILPHNVRFVNVDEAMQIVPIIK